MKKRFISYKNVVLLLVITGFTSTLLSGQVFLKEGSSIIERRVVKNETVTLKIQTYRGTLQWQESVDGTAWEDISEQTNAQLDMIATEETYIRVSVTDGNCDPVFSTILHLFTIELPTVLTGEITDISTTTAWCGGAVTSEGGDTVYTRGICWSIDTLPTIANDHSPMGSGIGTFGNLITGLASDTLHYVRAYATNSAGTAYGEQKQFTTARIIYPPTVTTADITSITHNSAEGGGTITNDGGDPLTSRGVCWSTSNNPTIADALTTDSTGAGTFISILTGLEDSTKYYVRAYAQNSAGLTYGVQKDFKTFQAPSLPTVITSLITCLAVDSVIGGGNVTADGGTQITARGICWNTEGNPTLNDSITLDSLGTGVFTSIIKGLDEQATYYIRAYATNFIGTAYGSQIRFTTASSEWAGTFTDSRDGHIYGYVAIGTQNWMAQNLAYQLSVSNPVDSSYTDQYFYVYDYADTVVSESKETENYYTYGVLYNWQAARISCPTGWKLPTDNDWKILEEFLGMNETDADKSGWRFSGDVGGKLRSTDLWAPSNYQGLDTDAFTARPGGKREVDGVFKLQTEFGYFWTNSANGTPDAWARSMWHTVGALNRYSADRSSGFSVRCIQE